LVPAMITGRKGPRFPRPGPAGFLALLCLPWLSFSQDNAAAGSPPYEFHGALREYVSVFGHSPHRLDQAQTRMKLELLSRLGGHAAFRVSGSVTGSADSQSLALDLKEAYIGWYSTFFEVYAGRQVTAWGKADGINPIDVLNPQDLTNPWEDLAIRKTGLFSVKGCARLLNLQLEMAWQPELGYSRVPPAGSPWAWGVPPSVPVLPENTMNNSTRAAKLSWSGSRLDASLCLVDGWGNRPVSTGMYRTRMAGADLASDLGPVRVWAEGAYFRTPDAAGTDPAIPNPSLQYVAGAGATLPGKVQATLQYVQEIITGIDNQTERTQEEAISGNVLLGVPLRQALALRLGRELDRDGNYRAEILAAYDFPENGILCNPRLNLAMTGALSGELGGLIFSGNQGSLLGHFRSNDVIYLKFLYSF